MYSTILDLCARLWKFTHRLVSDRVCEIKTLGFLIPKALLPQRNRLMDMVNL